MFRCSRSKKKRELTPQLTPPRTGGSVDAEAVGHLVRIQDGRGAAPAGFGLRRRLGPWC